MGSQSHCTVAVRASRVHIFFHDCRTVVWSVTSELGPEKDSEAESGFGSGSFLQGPAVGSAALGLFLTGFPREPPW